jgi:hypothetical protein
VYRAVTERNHHRVRHAKHAYTLSALLDLTKAGERRVEAFMRWAATCAQPLWSPFAVNRRDNVLARRCRVANLGHIRTIGPFGLVELSLSGESMRWQSFGKRHPPNRRLAHHEHFHSLRIPLPATLRKVAVLSEPLTDFAQAVAFLLEIQRHSSRRAAIVIDRRPQQLLRAVPAIPPPLSVGAVPQHSALPQSP